MDVVDVEGGVSQREEFFAATPADYVGDVPLVYLSREVAGEFLGDFHVVDASWGLFLL